MKLNIGVIFGGRSLEHELSILTAIQAMDNIDKERYEVVPIYISKDLTIYSGGMLRYIDSYKDFNLINRYARKVNLVNKKGKFILETRGLIKKEHKEIHLAFPMVHGKNTEDGGIIGYLETLGVPFVGSDIYASSTCQDKIFTKQILEASNLPVVDYVHFTDNDYKMDKEEIFKKIDKLSYPLIIKPARLGSSIGIELVGRKEELESSIEKVMQKDDRILIEEYIESRKEYNMAVLLSKGKLIGSIIEEIEKEDPCDYYDKYRKEEDNDDEVEDLTGKKIISSIDELTNGNVDNVEESTETDTPVEVVNYENAVVNNYILPDFRTLLKKAGKVNATENKSVVKMNVEKLEQVLSDFDIVGKVVEINIGPSITQYEVELKSGTKVNKVLSIQREIALALAAKDVRIQAPIPGKSTIGIELPNKTSVGVTLREIMEDIPKSMENSKLAVALGKNIMGKTMFMEINKTPHLLVAGATGSGKSVCINSIIVTLLLRSRPSEVKMVLVDPKKVEMSMYNGVPHLLMPVVTDPKKASIALMKMVSEMERRYNLFEESRTKNITDYNKYVEDRRRNLNGTMEKLPYIVIIIDELADLMLVAAKEVEDSILRITQMARAAGIHLIVATQRPSTDVITGIVKANIPSRISFAVSSSIDSRTILDMTGAEKLLGKGDMLFLPMGENSPVRIQGAYVSDEEINKVIDYTVSQQKAQYDEKFIPEDRACAMHNDDAGSDSDDEYDDPLYKDIVEFVVKTGKASASLLQRKFKLGYNRAARIMDLLEERGIVGPPNGSKPREVLVKLEENGGEEE